MARMAIAIAIVTFSLVAGAGSAASAGGGGRDVVPGQLLPHVIVHFDHNGKPHGGPPGGGGGGGGDVEHTTHYLLLPGQWAGAKPTVNVRVEAPDSGAMAAVEDGFNAWNGISKFSFAVSAASDIDPNTEVAAENGQNTVSWALLVGGWTNALAVTILWIDDTSPANGVWDAGEPIVEADLFFNSKYKWQVAPSTTKGKWYDIQNVMAHEAGHFVGLDDQSQWTDETMYFSAASKEITKRDLAPGDIAGAQSLYP